MPLTHVPVSTLSATYFEGPISNVDHPTIVAAVPDLIAGMRESAGELRSRILYIRERFADEDLFACEEAKKQLGCVVWSGSFSKRHHTGCTAYNGLIICDVDWSDDAAAVCERLRGQPHIVFTFLSPKGNGCKIGVLTDATRQEQHKVAYATVRNHMATAYGLELDGSGSDICRACFVSFDPEAWCAEQVEPLMVDANAVIAVESAKAGPLPAIGERISENRHQHLIVFQAKLAALGATIPILIAAGRAFADDRLDCSDGRVIPDDEIRRGAEGAFAKYHKGDAIAAIVHGMNVAAAWRAEEGLRNEIRAEVLAEIRAQGQPPAEVPTTVPATVPATPSPNTENTVEPWAPELLDPATWGGAIGACMNGILSSSMRPQPALTLACALNMVGTVLGRQVAGATGLRTNLYNIGVCETGGGKESALSFAKRIFYDAGIQQRFLQPEDIASDAAIETATRQKPSAIWLLDEIGRHLATMSSSMAAAHQSNIITILLKLYTKADSVYLGKAYGDANREVVPIIQPCVNVYGTCNPTDLYNAFKGVDVTNGFIPRLMIFHTDNHCPVRQKRGTDAQATDARLVEWFRLWGTNESALARAAEPCPVVLAHDPDAVAIFDDFSTWTDDHRRSLPLGDVGSTIMSRSVEKAMRVALIRAAGRHDPTSIAGATITGEDAALAVRLIKAIDRRVIVMSDKHISSSQEERKSKELQALIESTTYAGITASGISQRTRMPAKMRDLLLDTLIDAGIVVTGHINSRGRTVLAYFGAAFYQVSAFPAGEV